jgi:hypothetical protein
MKYYKFIVKGNDMVGGVLYSPADWPYPISRDAEPVDNWQSLVVELKDGVYRPFHACTGGANLVSQELRDLLMSFCGNDSCLEFLPIKAISEEFGNKIYYIMHFKKIFDVIDKQNTIYVEGTDSIIKLRLDSNKVNGLKIFNTQPAVNDIIVSEDVYKAIKREKLNLGLDFMQIYCGTSI